LRQQVSDRLIEAVLRRYQNIEWKTTSTEYKIGKPGNFYKGSIWVRPRKGVYRVQTTGVAQGMDLYIRTLVGDADGSQKSNEYKFWISVQESDLERLILEFDNGFFKSHFDEIG